jgi:hypothetical protein
VTRILASFNRFNFAFDDITTVFSLFSDFRVEEGIDLARSADVLL